MSKFYNMYAEHMLDLEGGYVNNPLDRGGETKYGISRNAYPELDIPNLTKEDAKNILKQDYWDVNKCDDMPPAIACYCADFSYNSGSKQAAKVLQRCCGVYDDGIVGPKTLKAVHSHYQKDLLLRYDEARRAYLLEVIKDKPYQEEFRKGWFNRCDKLLKFCKEFL